MSDRSDRQLLHDYATTDRQDAFAELVKRHVHLVHAAALRQAHGDPHLADDITQAVFIVLTRRAKSLGSQVSLPGWLINTTRYAALSAIKLQTRRRHHEQRSAWMIDPTSSPDALSLAHDKLAAALDSAIARLRTNDRSAIVLRYLQGKGVREVGEAMGISQVAAQKRILRALDRLRDVLARHGVTAPADLLESNLSAMGAYVAPALLIQTITAGGGAVTGGTIATLIAATHKSILVASAKTAGLAIAASVLVAGTIAPIVLNTQVASQAVAAAPPASIAPAAASVTKSATATTAPAIVPADANVQKLPNITFFQNYNPKEFTAGIDSETIRVPGGEPAAVLTSDTERWGDGGSSLRAVDATPYRGKRIRLTAYVKSQDLANWGSLWLFAVGPQGEVYANDDTGSGALFKTTDWQRKQIVCDIPDACDAIRCGLSLHGKGKIFLDSAGIEVVPTTEAITDDQNFHPWSFSLSRYSTKMDETTKRNGHATRLMESKTAGSGEWLSWDANNRYPEKFLGKKCKVSMWIKTESVTGPSGLLLDCRGPNFQSITPGLSKDQRTIKGTTDWTKYEFTADVPAETQNLCTGVRLGGKGKLWVDDLRCEVVE